MDPGPGPGFPFLQAIYSIVRRASAVHTFAPFGALFSTTPLYF